MTADPLRGGTLVANRFEVLERAGEGGMGTVYRALDTANGALVALKVLTAGGASEMARFERESAILADLWHPSIVRYVAHGTTQDGRPFLAMEWLEGEDLSQRLAREGLTVAESLQVLTGAAEALAVAHRRGILHRDIKPSNLFLVDRRLDRVKVLDFGIARMTVAASGLTRTGMMIGTPAYMSPEQARGAAGIDARADVFALGCVLFECITRLPPFVADHVVAVLAKILLDEPPRLAQISAHVSPRLDALVASMLAKDPAERPADAGVVAEALARIDAPTDQPRPSTPTPQLELGTREQRLLSVVLALPPGGGRAVQDAATLISDADAPRASLRAEVLRHGGRLEQLADGSLIATLAGSVAATDQAARAARCALAMRVLMPDALMAIATGRGLVTDGWPLGEVIDRAVERLRAVQRSSAGREPTQGPPIGIDDVTAGLLDAHFEVGGDAGGLRLHGECSDLEPVRTLLGKVTSCVGRDRELAALMDLFNECVEEPAARAVLLSSVTGIGKSRLRAEFVRRLRARAQPVEVWTGRGDPISAGSPFALLADALRTGLGIRTGEALAVRQHKLRARVEGRVPANQQQRVIEFLGELIDVPFPDERSVQLRAARQDATLMGDQVRLACADFFAAECLVQPVVLVLENLHWGDLPTVSLVDGLLRHLSEGALMVIGLGRPEVTRSFPRLWEDRNLTTLRLGELSRKACERLVREVLGAGALAPTVARIVELAAGNAFYLEELIRAVASGNDEALPETVMAMVQARLEDLEPEARRVLRAASIFGETFRGAGVYALLGSPQRTAQIVAWLPELVRRELVTRRAGAELTDDEYVFRHALVRDAAYAALTDADRRLGHTLAGEWYVRTGERDALVLAEHFDRGGALPRAAECYRLAAEQALEGHDFQGCLQRAGHATRCGATGPELGLLHLITAEALRWEGNFVEAERSATQALELLQRGAAAWFRASAEVMIAAGRRGDYAVAETIAADLDATTWTSDVASERASCLCVAARQLFHAARYDLASAILVHVHRLVHTLTPRALAEIHRLRGAHARHLGDLGGAAAGYEAALAAFEQVGDVRNACNARVSLAFGYIELGDYAAARDELEQASVAATRMGLQTILQRARQNLSLVLAGAGALGLAASAASSAIASAHEHGDVRFEGWTRIYLSRIHLLANRAEEAEREARAAVELLVATPPAGAGALAAASQALLAGGRVEEALAAAREAHATLTMLGGIEEFEAMIRLAYAESSWAAGHFAVAREVIAVARDRVHAQAAAIADPAVRARFLANVPDNVRIAALARTWLEEDG